MVVSAQIVDWKPFEYYTFTQRAEPFGNIEYLQTRRLIPLENGTRVLVTLSKPDGDIPDETRGAFEWMLSLFGNLKAIMDEEIAKGNIVA